ncbi:hypothetical protein CH373_12000 [Leptospira perolatii]|uniref:Lipoprotein n=1 Tax=Leptospira perolatii TaxID=2023191 RepID=A0A2M9ZL39_9LEPT|nr:hypothetical protein [Leptospira perolatii]PJZ70330.1 hypothetical protein CH360_06970 [Leptospira perolatii]PJZ72786.1 hypothetical protein CH373_12000 [Leptospira perolatii]
MFSRFALPFIFLIVSCGVNTEVAQSPFVFLTPVGVPQVYSMIPTNDGITGTFTQASTADGLYYQEPNNLKPEFFLRYYITNLEPQFVGYNLYITTAFPSPAETFAGGNIYLENGVQPSFAHLAIDASTSRLVTHRIRNLIPPPGITPFNKCEIYTFTLRAVLNTGITSIPSTAISQCASIRPDLCTVGSSCNPVACSSASTCPTDALTSCPLGTVCNPCSNPSTRDFGCPCAVGSTPPGCNL